METPSLSPGKVEGPENEQSESAPTSEPLAVAPVHSERPNPEPLTVAVLRRKLDAAILAEGWAAVKVIHERIVEAERAEAGNVVAIDGARRGRT
jgi:hypothetical protein